MASFFNRITRKENPTIYQNKDGHLKRTLRVRDFLALGVRYYLFLLQFSLYLV
ncbi:amino acid permease family protein [Staphylococcus saccharolyticus]|uniref:Amino acid permease family protein n=1 Tax=Staphylococcus saccharolyticus TaxID=33028 RepID=A0A380H063_9STAP|nr:amino acid permease family protein [Staphylococcus saccharolyticus]